MTRSAKQVHLYPDMLQEAASVLKVIGHPVRLSIIEFLEGGEKNVGEIQQHVGLQQAITSQHLNYLRVRGLLTSRREGSRVFYSISNQFLLRILSCIKECAFDPDADPR